MKHGLIRKLALHVLPVAALLAASGAAHAHRQWFLPSQTSLSGEGNWVTVDAAVSNDLFVADHVPMQLKGIAVTRPDGSEGKVENGATGRYRSVFDVKIDQPGTWKIGTVARRAGGSFVLNGEKWSVSQRRRPLPGGGFEVPPNTVPTADKIPAGATDIRLVETIARNEFYVTADAPTTTVFQPAGEGLEFMPDTHPGDLVADEAARFVFLVDGKPAAGVKVEIVPGGKQFREKELAQTLETGADGAVEVRWPFAGFYWLSASADDDRPSADSKATSRQMRFTTTLEVQAP